MIQPAFLDALMLSAEAMARLFLVASIGFILVRRGVFGQEAIGGTTRLMIDVVVPSALCVSMVKGFDGAAMVEASPLILLPAIWVTGTILVALAAFRLTRGGGATLSADRAAAALCGIQNSFYIPLPLVLAVTNRDQHAMVYVYIGMVVLAVNPIQWTLGSWLVMGSAENERRHWKESLRHTINGPVVGVVSGALLSQVPGLPEAARGEFGASPLLRLPMATMEMVGAAMAPLAMILTGALVAQCRIRHALKLRHVAATLAFRFLIVPGAVLALLRAGEVPASPLVALVLMVQAAAPPAMNTALVARRYDGEWEVVSALLLVTNLCALVALPVWMAVAMKL